MTIIKWIGIGVAGLVLLAGLFLLVSLYMLSRNQPATAAVTSGVTDGRLAPCPPTPNCVSTHASPSDELHYIEPIRPPAVAPAKERIIRWIEAHPRAELVTQRDDYIHATFRSRLFGFIDDVELYFPPEEGVVHLRSAARVGQGDMGVNRGRAEEIREVLTESGGN